MSKENLKNNVDYDGLKSVVINKTFCYDNLALKKSLEGLIDSLYRPSTHTSLDYKNWIAILDLKTCSECRNLHGKIYCLEERPESEPPLHERCRCEIKNMAAAFIGTATKDGINGADVYVSINGHLPDSPGRVWYEADINYESGYQNHHRLIYSNDGLIFATYDHYETFVQIH